ncbi:MAG: DUF4440 domain-containing protein [Acetobacteraceae bacterium]|nr:DUF4440 domain-containing protein [Acetobacteraceae bacterium]
MKALIPVIALGAFLASPAFAEDAVSITQNLGQQWKKAYDARDAAALTALYAKDAVLLPQGVDHPLSGEAAIRDYYDDEVKHPVSNFIIKTTQGKMTGPDVGYGAGTWSADVPGQNGGPSMHVMGTFLSVVAREGADWKLRADTWNMVPPAQQ